MSPHLKTSVRGLAQAVFLALTQNAESCWTHSCSTWSLRLSFCSTLFLFGPSFPLFPPFLFPFSLSVSIAVYWMNNCLVLRLLKGIFHNHYILLSWSVSLSFFLWPFSRCLLWELHCPVTCFSFLPILLFTSHLFSDRWKWVYVNWI